MRAEQFDLLCAEAGWNDERQVLVSRLGSVERWALQVLIDTDLAWTFEGRLARSGIKPETLEGLEASGWIVRWPTPKGMAWTLHPWGAWALGVVIVEEGAAESPRWGDPSEETRYVVAARSDHTVRLWFPELVRDKGPSAEDSAELREFLARCVHDPAEGKYYLRDPRTGDTVRVGGSRVEVDLVLARRRRMTTDRAARSTTRGLQDRKRIRTSASSRLAS
jgi:hypothetical protein